MTDLKNIENEIRRMHKLRMLQQKISEEMAKQEQLLMKMLDANRKELAERGEVATEILLLEKTINEREQKIKEVLAKVDLILEEYDEILSEKEESLFDLEN